MAKYLETRSRLSEKLNEVFKKIADHKRQRDDMAVKLKQVQVSLIEFLIDVGNRITESEWHNAWKYSYRACG